MMKNADPAAEVEESMTQQEFIQELEQALRGQVSPQVAEYNVNYYREYIREQLASGKSSEEVFGMLGSPQMIAKTIISAEEASGHTTGGYAGGGTDSRKEEKEFHFSIEEIKEGPWYKKAAAIAIVLIVLYLVLSILFAVVRILFWPAVIVIAAVAIWQYVINKK